MFFKKLRGEGVAILVKDIAISLNALLFSLALCFIVTTLLSMMSKNSIAYPLNR